MKGESAALALSYQVAINKIEPPRHEDTKKSKKWRKVAQKATKHALLRGINALTQFRLGGFH